METKIIRDAADLPAAAAALKLGGLVAVPTETVYGLCCNGLDVRAVESLYERKGRPEVKPLSLMVPKAAAIGRYGRDVPPAAYYLAERYWPGPLTIIVRSKDTVPSIVRAGGDTVGLRCPRHPLTLALLEQTGFPLAGPSANPSGRPSPTDAQQVLSYFDGEIEAVVDGGACAVGTESTIVDLSSAPYRILREGAVPAAEIVEALRSALTVVGITGGTGSGKTTALHTLAERGALIIDCDQVYRELTRTSREMERALTLRFGPKTYRNGELDRKALARLVFTDPEARQDLNAITHRFVSDEVERRLRAFALEGGTLAAIDAIALFESGIAERCAFTLGVTAREETRLARITARDRLSREDAQLRISAQPPEEYYREHCDYILENNGTMEEFEAQCRGFFDQVLQGGK